MARRTLLPPNAAIVSASRAAMLQSLAAALCWLRVAGQSSVEGPSSQADQPAWLQALKADRNKTLKGLDWKGGAFARVPWTQTAYIQPQMHPYDRYFYDPDKDVYTVQRYLQDLKDRYGGIDALLMWPTYTNIGSDDRNQFDYFRSMPGGLEGVRKVTAELKAAGVRVLWPYNPWDTGTRREPLSDEDTFAELLKQTGGDGFNGDTMGSVPESFWYAALNKSYPLAFEPENPGPDAALNWTTMGWGYWSYPSRPVVDRFKFITRGKWMTNVCDRWAKDRTYNLQSAWLSGDGYESWENVWGTWNGITPYDGEAIRRVGTMLRYFGKEGFLQSPDWEPYTREVWQEGIHASKFPLPVRNQTVWTVISRNNLNLTVGLVVGGGKKYYDCYHGEELKAAPAPTPKPIPAEPQGYNIFQGQNCFQGQGGDEIDKNPLAGLSRFECAARCNATQSCSCVAWEEDGCQCWRRAACDPQHFSSDNRFTVFLKAEGYTNYTGLNCYSGHGATDIDPTDTPAVGRTVAQCQQRCTDDAKCECVTYQVSTGKCWKRSGCEASACQPDNYNVYMNEARRPAPRPNTPLPGPQVSFPMEAYGYGCFFETEIAPEDSLAELLATMKSLTAKPLSSYDHVWKFLPQRLVEIPKTTPAIAAPAGMVYVPRVDNFSFVVSGMEIEGGDGDGVDVQYPWEEHPQREHNQIMAVGPFYIDKYPVTNANYSSYLQATGFRPKDSYNWLKSWNGSATPVAELAEKPVTYIGLNEARKYCAWAGGRLPHSWEWQYAAQGVDGRKYPWGSDKNQSKYPVLTSGNTFTGPESVMAHAPIGDSVFGVSDLVGNVWQYTDEFRDDHTRAVILRGGSNYRPTGSHWYLPQALELDTHQKYFLFNDRYERAGTIGFRCVVDAVAPEHDIIV